jgi:hypothetical protein
MRSGKSASKPQKGLPNMSFHPFQIDDAGAEQATEKFKESGFFTLEAALAPDFYGALMLEAFQQRSAEVFPDWLMDPTGAVFKNSIRGYPGHYAGLLMMAPRTLALLEKITGEPLEASWESTCYTYYEGVGSCTGKHVDDADSCSVTMLVGLESVWPHGAEIPPGNHLRVFTVGEKATAVDIPTLPNRVLILNGKSIPHERPVLAEGQKVTILAAGFRSVRVSAAV